MGQIVDMGVPSRAGFGGQSRHLAYAGARSYDKVTG